MPGIFAGLLAGGADILGALFGGAEAAGAAAIPAMAGGAALDTGAAAGALDLGSLLAGGAAPTVAGADLTGMTLSPFATGALTTGGEVLPTIEVASAAPAFAAADAIAPSAVVGGDFAALGLPAAADVASPLPTLGASMGGGAAPGVTSALASPTATGVTGGLSVAAPGVGAGAMTPAGVASTGIGAPFGGVLGENAANVGAAAADPWLTNVSNPALSLASTTSPVAASPGQTAISGALAGAPPSNLGNVGTGILATGGGTGGGITAGTGLGGATDAMGGAGGTNLLDTLMGAGKSLIGGANPLMLGLGAAGLGYNIYTGQKALQSQQSMMDLANQQRALGNQMQGYLSSGTLPPGLQAGLDKASASAKAQIIQGYANRGQSTDPSLNSALAADLQGVDIQKNYDMVNLETQLFNLGQQGISLSNTDFNNLMNLEQKQSENVGAALSNFARAAGGGTVVPKTAGGMTVSFTG
jgi:hypothetical protein